MQRRAAFLPMAVLLLPTVLKRSASPPNAAFPAPEVLELSEVDPFAVLKDPVVCFLSALDTMEVSGLQVSLGQFSDLVIDGFDSPGVKRLLDTLIEAGFVAYEPTLLRAVPYFFQVPVRNIIKNDILNQFLGDNNECLSKAQNIADYPEPLPDIRFQTYYHQ